MEKEAKTPTIDQAIQHYWGLRAEGYSLSNVEELADADNLYRNLLQRWLPGSHLGQKSLDIGCGNGRNSRYLASQGFWVTGIDFSEQSIRWAKALTAKEENINFQCISMLEYTADANSFDFILDSGCFHHIKPHRREQYLSGILNCLKEDGYFLMTCFNPDGGANISDYDVYRDYSMHGGLGFSEYKIKKILSNYFDIVDFRKMKETDNIRIFGKDFMWVILMKKKAAGK